MEIIGNIADILSSPWVSWTLTVIFAAAGVFLKTKLNGVKVVVDELVHIAKVHNEATDPKSEAGTSYSPAERDKQQKEVQDLIGALAALVKK